MGFPRIGLEGYFALQEFRKGVQEYTTALGLTEDKTKSTATGMTAVMQVAGTVMKASLGAAALGVSAAIAGVTSAAIASTREVLAWGATVGAVSTTLGTSARESSALAVAIQSVGGDVGQVTQQLGAMTRNLFQANGELGPAGQALQALGIAFQDANGNMLPAGTILQNIAKVLGPMPNSLEKTTILTTLFGEAGKDLNKVLSSLANGGMSEAERRAQSLGLLLSDTDLAATKALQGELNFLSLALQGLGNTFGQALVPGLLLAVQGIGKFLTVIVQAMQEGGALHPIIEDLGNALLLLGGTFNSFSDDAAGGLIGWLGNLYTSMKQAAVDALSWGLNIVAQLATGIVEGATSALNAAMDFVGNMLSFWLAPGSPPKVAPEIDSWGMSAMAEYLNGMSSADFGTLKAIQGPLQQVLGSVLDPKAAAGAFEGITKGLSDAIRQVSKGGPVNSKVFEQIRASAGQYGGELARLARDQIELAAATLQTKAAADALTAAQNRQQAASAKVSSLTREYNNMLRAGASKEALAAKLKEINAAEKERDAADKDARVKQANLDLAKQEEQAAKDKADATAELVQQTLALLKAQEAANKEEKAPKEKAAGGGTQFKLPSGAGGAATSAAQITGSVKGAFDDLRKSLNEKLRNLFKPLTEAWFKHIVPAIDGLKKKFFWFRDVVAQAWEEMKKRVAAVVEWFQTRLPVLIAQGLQEAVRWFVNFNREVAVHFAEFILMARQTGEKVIRALRDGMSAVWDIVIKFLVAQIGAIPAALAPVVAKLISIGQDIVGKVKEGVSAVWNTVTGLLASLIGAIPMTIASAIGGLIAIGTQIVEKIKTGLSQAWSSFTSTISGLLGGISIGSLTADAISALMNFGAGIWNKIVAGVKSMWTNFTDGIGKLLAGLSIGALAADALAALSKFGGDAIAKIWDGMKSAWKTYIVDNLNWIVNQLPQWFKDLLGISGEISVGNSSSVSSTVTGPATPSATSAYTPAAASASYTTNNWSFSPTINNGMDLAAAGNWFQQQVADSL